MSVKISGVVITYNEEDFIERCLKSMIGVVDEIIVVDSYSTDKTKEISKKYNPIFIEKEFESFGKQKNFAVEQASHDYVLCLDADEALSDTLKKTILTLKENWTSDAYRLKFRHFYCGKWLKYGSDNRKIRLFNRRKAKWTDNIVHETVELYQSMSTPVLKGHILHIEYQSYFEHATKINYYTTLSAKSYQKNKKTSSIFRIIYKPVWAFINTYIIQLSFLDGSQGLIRSKFAAYTTYLKYVKLHGLQNGHAISEKK